MPSFSPEKSLMHRGMRLLQAALRVLASMHFAIGLLAGIALLSVIGTILPQGRAYSFYVGLYGVFWTDIFEILGFFHVYQTWWYLLMLAFLATSTTLCITRNAPKILRDLRSCKEDVHIQALQALGQKNQKLLLQSASTAAHTLGQSLANMGWHVRLQKRALPQENGWMVAARRGGFNRIGYLAGHSAVVLICLGGLLDSHWLLQWQMHAQGKTPYQGTGLIAQIPARHRLSSNTLGFRGNLFVPEGTRADAAIVPMQGGWLVQELPFALELKKFHIDYYHNGTPRLFASDVVLHDRQNNASLPVRIEVNHPFFYRGVSIFQSGFEDGGSKVTLQAVPLDRAVTSFELKSAVGKSILLDQASLQSKLEITALHSVNIENVGFVKNAAAFDADIKNDTALSTQKSQFPMSPKRILQKQLGAAHDWQTQNQWRDIGPSIAYTLRDASGQAKEFHNYARPVLMRADAVPEFLFGVRDRASGEWNYLRIPADDNGGLEEFLRLRSSLLDPQQRARAVRRYVSLVSPANDPQLKQQLTLSTQRVLDQFAGSPSQWLEARNNPQSMAARSFGLAGLATLVGNNVPAAQQEQATAALLRLLNGALFQLLQLTREQQGLAPLDLKLPRNQAFMNQAVIALNDAPFYPEVITFRLKNFHQIYASVFQMVRTPGKWIVYVGSLLLVLGIFAMLYVRERRLWIWLQPGQQPDTSQALLAYSSTRRNNESSQEFERLNTLLQGDQIDESTI